jgi:hypothetical protein
MLRGVTKRSVIPSEEGIQPLLCFVSILGLELTTLDLSYHLTPDNRGLAKNHSLLYMLFASANLVLYARQVTLQEGS